MTLLPIDELNVFEAEVSAHFENGKIRSETDLEDIIDELLDFFLLAYANGTAAANADLGTDIEPTIEDVQRAVNDAVAGETWRERVERYYREGGSEFDITRIAETDMTRIYNTAVLDVADKVSNPTTMKRWNTMLDSKVRDTHAYLEGMTVPYDRDFFTYDGDHAKAPGMFSNPSENCGCRCVIELLRGE